MGELNWQPGQSAELQLLGDAAAKGGSEPARILEVAGKRMHVAAGRPVKSGAAVRLDWEGQLLLGQVLYSDAGGFWMEVHHMLLDGGGESWQKNGWRSG